MISSRVLSNLRAGRGERERGRRKNKSELVETHEWLRVASVETESRLHKNEPDVVNDIRQKQEDKKWQSC